MSNAIYPCLWFDGKAGAAAAFYASVFKDARVVSDTPMVSVVEIHGKKIMGLNGGPVFTINPAISLFVRCETIAETNRVWQQLIEGGSALMDIGTYPWSERYGWLKDQFGMTWQIAVVNNPGEPASICPSLLFTGQQFGRGAEAIRFYSGIFKTAETLVEYPYPDQDPNAGKLLYAEILLNGSKLIAMDGPGEHLYSFNEAVSLVVDCSNQDEVDHYWNKLTAEGGKESRCGWLKDRFGISWQIVPRQLGEMIASPDREKAGRAMQAMLKMNKLIIADLEKAYQGT